MAGPAGVWAPASWKPSPEVLRLNAQSEVRALSPDFEAGVWAFHTRRVMSVELAARGLATEEATIFANHLFEWPPRLHFLRIA